MDNIEMLTFNHILRHSKTNTGERITFHIIKRPGPNPLWNDHFIMAKIDGVAVGEIVLSYIPDSAFEEKDAFEKWAFEFKNIPYGTKHSKKQSADLLKEFLSFKSFQNENPFVAYIEVFDRMRYASEDPFLRQQEKNALLEERISIENNRGRGIGRALYIAGATLMACDKKTLNSGTLQSKDAIGFWEHNCMKIPNCTAYQYVGDDGEIYTRYRIDYISEFESARWVIAKKQGALKSAIENGNNRLDKNSIPL